MLLTFLFPGQGGTPWVWVCQLWSASSLLINHNPAVTRAAHPDSCTVRISSQQPKFLKLHWFFLKTKLFSDQLQFAWQCNHVCKPHPMFLACNWRLSLPRNMLYHSPKHILHWDTGEEISHMDLLIPWMKKVEENYTITLVKAMGDLCQPPYNTEILQTRCCVRHLASAANGDIQCQRNTAFLERKWSA